MTQLAMFHGPDHAPIVNVASVPQRSPFRYPGGKTWLVPTIRRWFGSFSATPTLFVEPFAGGAIVGLTVAFEGLADKVVLVEIDEQVAAVWNTILSNDNEWLARRILDFDINLDRVKATLSTEPRNTRELAFQTILMNRTYHGGILAPGSSLMKFGENGRGIQSRWYPQTLARRIRAIAMVSNKIKFIRGDGIAVIREHSHRKTAAFFVDPPYTVSEKRAGGRLYTHHELNHRELFRVCANVKGDVLMTYDHAGEVVALAESNGLDWRTIAMKNTHNTAMTELLVGRRLNWLG